MTTANLLPSGWLIEPNGQKMILFIKDPMSHKTLRKFYIDKWSAVNGKRTKFENRKIVLYEEATKTWDNLVKNGWYKTQVSNIHVA